MALAQQKVPVAATPPMGWNNWNHFGQEISEDLVRAQADAMVKNGMKAVGYTYVNIDDGWAGNRDRDGFIHPNAKFPDVKGLADYIHGLGLRFGIYTAGTAKTCKGLEGSRGHEEQDAETYAKWGVDFVKVDWCSDETNEELVYKEYKKLGEALRKTGRPMVYSIGAPGAAWRWGTSVGGNLWRTSIDIKDNWNWMSAIGFSQNGLERFAGPGHWNDPDMLEVGNDGFDNGIISNHDAWSLRRPAPPELPGMTEEEYRTHMSLWCLLAAPLIVGADLAHLRPSALSLLTNPEVIAVDQDALGMQGYRVAQEGALEVWVKPLTDGSKAVGLFNRELGTMAVTVYFRDIRVGVDARVRDLWARKDLGRFQEKYTANVAEHGVVLIQVRPAE
jgi:alpha-galactosidase